MRTNSKTDGGHGGNMRAYVLGRKALRLPGLITTTVVALLLCSCATTKSNMPDIPAIPAPQSGAGSPLPGYRVQVGDQLGIRLPLNAELNEEITVRPDGMISTSVAEDIPAYNRTPAEISSALRDGYKWMLKEPRLAVIVRSFAPNRVYVGGEVNNPGEFITIGPNLTISQAIARAGGVKLSGERSRIFVIRRGPNDVPQVFKVDYMNIITGKFPQADARLAQYDVLFVPRTGVYEVFAFWNQFVQQFVPVSWGFSYNANPSVSVQR